MLAFTIECVDNAVITSLLRPFVALSPEMSEQTSRYLDLLLKWNSKINLTAVREAEAIITRHFGESFFAARMLFPKGHQVRVVDVGSGAGFPGLPLAMFAPEVQVTLIEADSKKAAFLNEAIRELDLKNVKVFNGRAETYAGNAELVTMRAVEKFEKALPIALGVVVNGGRIALMIGASQLGEVDRITGDVNWQDPQIVPGGKSRLLLVGTKLVQESKR